MNKKIPYPCVILCGGKSSRMKQDKSLLEINGKSLALYQYEKLSYIFKDVFISTKNDKFNNKNIKLILDDSSTHSPLVALNSILKKFQDTYVFIISVDTPNISQKTLWRLFENLQNQKILLASTQSHKHYLCGFYHGENYRISSEFLKENNHKLALFCDKVNANFIYFSDENEFINLNYYDEYKKWILNTKNLLKN
ncbi:molybdenum cofactor guanylyltransferase [Campylobacter insulaenigrae]|uniref:molybdenum cofactor guanylyltransferase n=1 Tax=Campylobacter insulaenigrae TaxID=260714 RepID=UPI002152BC78|nr:molybdenum cofactor guanylyltransferase [Campylobacter insulaenigrae]MCR6574134.1 molybdenum cofactor guanylyltransferase [Campylobacter insulaenigrae]MCR6580506.1 molybdenum cofactor guanylyltransferase [Campylobacter insulaenigrae]MCR6586633.1 molybdenum cofactor guanylyltransferase [Campylobacter insulaenigrae]